MRSVTLNTWDEARNWVDDRYLFKPSLLELVGSGKYPKDAFTVGQLASKVWLLDVMRNHVPVQEHVTVSLLGCWISSLAQMLYQHFAIDRMYGFDNDSQTIALSEDFNRSLYNDGWKYKGVVQDVDFLNCSKMEFITSGEHISVKPDWIINTSCEHMSTRWFHTVESDQLIIMQTNDSPNYLGHINTCATVDEMKEKYPLRNIFYIGELQLPDYTRYMQIGYK